MCDAMRATEEYVHMLVGLRKVPHHLRDSRASEIEDCQPRGVLQAKGREKIIFPLSSTCLRPRGWTSARALAYFSRSSVPKGNGRL